MAAWDDHKYVRPEPGSVWTILPGGAALFTAALQSGSTIDVTDRAARALGVVTTDDTDNATLRELRAIRRLLMLLVREQGYDLDVASLLTESAA